MHAMKKEFTTQQAKFIYSKDELGYQEVLDEMKNASEITVITYNISERQTFLMNCIKAAPTSCSITIVTNIPNRWETYYRDNYREMAKKKIDVYLTKLSPESLGEKASVFFNFGNHGKIIMTDTVAYVGSANYSEESQNNSEFGFICRDNEFVTFLKSEVLPEIESASVPYYEYNYTGLILEANMVVSAVFNLYNELHEETYALHDDIDGEWFYYIEHEDTLNTKTLEAINEVLNSANTIARDIYDAVDGITGSDDDELDKINELYENLLDLAKTAESSSTSDEIYELAHFGYNNHIEHLLQTDYAMEAYEDNLENCIDRASGEAGTLLFELCANAKDSIDELLETIKKYQEVFTELIDSFSQYDIKKVNPTIDNT
jgi:hypothetical protein